MMETINKAIVQITISDDEDEGNTWPSKCKPSSKVKEETGNDVKKAVISIIIPDEEEDENPLRNEPKHCASANEQETNCQVSSSTQSVISPGKKLKVSDQNIKKLKAMVKLQKLDLGSRGIMNGNISFGKSENNHFEPQCEPSTSSSTSQVQMAKNECKVNSKQPRNPEIGIFESVEKRFSQENKEPLVNKSLLVNTKSGIKRSKSPPSSSSMRQSTLSDESFSPKKKPTTMYGCPRQAVEQPLHYDTPLYCSVELRKPLLNPEPQNKDFTENQMNSLQALKEEDFHQSYVNTVTSFMSQCRKPPPALVFHMFHNILLEKQSSCTTECFRILRQIQVLHPAVPARMVAQKITWEYINSMIVKQSADSCLAVNLSMALAFLISVMEEEVEMKKTFSLVKTSAYRLLSVKHFTHICDVVQWIGQAIGQHATSQCSRGCGHNVCPVHLLQRLLMLSLSISERPEDCASRIADELFLVYNWQLRSIENKTLLLQSMKSHLLRIKLIEVILSNCCPSQVEQDNEQVPRSGLRQIILFDFKRSPSMNDAECADTIANNCEEFIMLLAYFLQSFVFCRKRSLQKNTSGSLRIMSLDDVDALLELDEEIPKLREHLENFCSPSPLSSRCYQLFDLMLSLKSFAKKLP